MDISDFGVEFFNLTGTCPPQFSGLGRGYDSNVISTCFAMIVVYESGERNPSFSH